LQEVRKRRSAAIGLRHAELIGVDWELPSSFGLTRRRRKPRRSFGAARRGLGMLIPARTEFAGARVCGDEEEVAREMKERGI
jgi:hypothetical protein